VALAGDGARGAACRARVVPRAALLAHVGARTPQAARGGRDSGCGGGVPLARVQGAVRGSAEQGEAREDEPGRPRAPRAARVPPLSARLPRLPRQEREAREKTQVCLYASNIAACIGMNPYKKPHKALEEM